MPNRDLAIPDSVRRLVLTSIPSVPFLEAARVIHGNAAALHTAQTIALALYMPPAAAEKLLLDLRQAGIVAAEGGGYRYAPRDAELSAGLEELFDCYRSNLVGITNLVHDTTQRSAERFANAFKLRKEP